MDTQPVPKDGYTKYDRFYTIEGVAHFMLCLLMDESKDDPIADVIKKLMNADLLHSCLNGDDDCLRFQEEMIEDIKTWDAPFDEERLK